MTLLGLVLHLGINQERLGLRVDSLHGVLESIEEACHRALDLALKANRQVLLDDAVTACEEGKNGLNEVPLILRESLKVVAGEVNLLGGPEGSQLLLLHLVEILLVIGNGKEGITHDGISSLENLRSVLQECRDPIEPTNSSNT